MRRFCFVLLLFLFSSVFAEVSYNIILREESADVNVVFNLRSDSAVDIWHVTWMLPDGAVIDRVGDEGIIDKYNISGSILEFNTKPDDDSFNEDISINLKLYGADIFDDKYAPLRLVSLSLPSFYETTTVNVRSDRRILGGSQSLNFTPAYGDFNYSCRGSGPVTVFLSTSKEGVYYNNLVSFSDYNFTLADQLYPLIVNVTGINVTFPYFSVMVLPDEEYEARANDWSAGIYEGNGVIMLRNSTMESDNNISILLHELSHGFTGEALAWDETSISWFNEGVAKYIEYLANYLLGIKQAELFGNNLTYSDDNFIYTIPARGRADDLWNYYFDGLDYLKYWNPDNESVRDFGYSFAELIVRDLIKNNGLAFINKIYENLLKIDYHVNNSIVRNNLILSILNYTLKPCYFDYRDAFNTCISEINNYPVPFKLSDYVDVSYSVVQPVNLSQVIEVEEAPFIEDIVTESVKEEVVEEENISVDVEYIDIESWFGVLDFNDISSTSKACFNLPLNSSLNDILFNIEFLGSDSPPNIIFSSRDCITDLTELPEFCIQCDKGIYCKLAEQANIIRFSDNNIPLGAHKYCFWPDSGSWSVSVKYNITSYDKGAEAPSMNFISLLFNFIKEFILSFLRSLGFK